MSRFRRYPTLPLLASLILAGCAAPGTFPSLARRPQETAGTRITGSLPAPLASPAPSGSASPVPVAVATLEGLRAEAEAAHRSFADRRARDGATISAGREAATGSEAWARGSAALADLTATHDATVAALATLDGLYVQDRVDGGDGGAIAAVRDQVTAWVADEDAVLADLVGPGAAAPARSDATPRS